MLFRSAGSSCIERGRWGLCGRDRAGRSDGHGAALSGHLGRGSVELVWLLGVPPFAKTYEAAEYAGCR